MLSLPCFSLTTMCTYKTSLKRKIKTWSWLLTMGPQFIYMKCWMRFNQFLHKLHASISCCLFHGLFTPVKCATTPITQPSRLKSALSQLQYIPRNMHTVLLCFALLWLCNCSYWFHMKYLSLFIRVALLALGQSLDCHSASEVSLVDMGKYVNV